ncbi:MAG: ubiquinone-binding protein [Alphaproteobacteria bacterium RIFOXYD12_FULL_60_8]|nr:MAG: ubiquinone-binding protein [Alphaproteobacteria bacterium RIFOXYD12_FULL_60_8]
MPRHAERRVVPYSVDQMFDLVADIEKYPDFLPWCVAARIRRREGDVLLADLVIGFKMIRERYTSRVALNRAEGRIDVAYTEGPFSHLENHWRFEPCPEGGCEVDFFVDFAFKNRVLDALMGRLFGEAVGLMVGAFDTRAQALYGEL